MVTLLLSLGAMAQAPDFSGTWKLNSAKSKLNEQFSMAPQELVIGQQTNNLTVVRHSEFQGQAFTNNDAFTLDGKECVNEGWQDTSKKSTANWSADKKSLIIKTTIPFGEGGEMNLTETYQLVDGCLSVKTQTSSEWGDSEETYLFDKK